MEGREEGRIIGDYRIVREIGRGAMATVYEAIQLKLGRPVALKVLHAGFAGEVKAVRRFLREAEAIGRLRHPGIVAIHDRGQTDDGVPFIAMDLVEGPALRRVIRHASRRTPENGEPGVDGDLPGPETPARKRIEFAVEIGRQIADALQHAHERGVVHRDVKPGNVLMEGGRARVADFGLADVMWGSRLTATGDVIGTPAYMSPEQAHGGEADARSDVYSLGATLYELITLQQSIDGGSLQDYLRRIPVEEPTPIRKLVPEASRDLETVLARTMAKEPERRYPTAADLRDDLRSVLDGGPIVARPDGPLRKLARQSRRRPRTTLSVAAIVIAMLSAWILFALWPEDSRHGFLRIETDADVTVHLHRLSPNGYPEWRETRDLGEDVREVGVEPGSYWLVVEAQRAFAEIPMEIVEGESLLVKPVLVPTDEVTGSMIRVEAGDYEFPNLHYGLPEGAVPVRSFWLDRTEVSVRDYLRFVEQSGNKPPRLSKRWPPEEDQLDLPMTHVTCFEAQAYAEHHGKRLPLAREWLAAYYGPSGHAIEGGNIDGTNAIPVTQAGDVSPFGILNLNGNVNEWTLSWALRQERTLESLRVVRTASRIVLGNSHVPASWVAGRPGVRTQQPGEDRVSGLGFRCAKSTDPR